MKRGAFIGILAVPFLLGAQIRAEPLPVTPKVGDTYELSLIRDSSQRAGDQSSGSSHDGDVLNERVVGLRSDGLELEYDLPNPTAEDRAREWKFPVRVFKPSSGPAQLLNGAELETRVDAWLRAAKWPRTICGHWIFTWNAFRIECDPQSAISTVEAFDLRSADVREGAAYRDSAARVSGALKRQKDGPDGATFAVEMPVDPDTVRRARAEGDVAAGEIMRKPVTFEAALAERVKETISGTVSVKFNLDSNGVVRRRTRVVELEIKMIGGQSETRTTTETLERRLIHRGPH